MNQRQLVGTLVAWVVLSLACSSDPTEPLLAMLPANHEVEQWSVEGVTVARTDGDLYKLIDGGAPKYLNAGSQASCFATYGQRNDTMQVDIHDMGTPHNAEAMYQSELPTARTAIEGRTNAVVNQGLVTAYMAIAHQGRYYVEVSIDNHSAASLASLTAFTARILDRAGAHP